MGVIIVDGILTSFLKGEEITRMPCRVDKVLKRILQVDPNAGCPDTATSIPGEKVREFVTFEGKTYPVLLKHSAAMLQRTYCCANGRKLVGMEK